MQQPAAAGAADSYRRLLPKPPGNKLIPRSKAPSSQPGPPSSNAMPSGPSGQQRPAVFHPAGKGVKGYLDRSRSPSRMDEPPGNWLTPGHPPAASQGLTPPPPPPPPLRGSVQNLVVPPKLPPAASPRPSLRSMISSHGKLPPRPPLHRPAAAKPESVSASTPAAEPNMELVEAKEEQGEQENEETEFMTENEETEFMTEQSVDGEVGLDGDNEEGLTKEEVEDSPPSAAGVISSLIPALQKEEDPHEAREVGIEAGTEIERANPKIGVASEDMSVVLLTELCDLRLVDLDDWPTFFEDMQDDIHKECENFGHVLGVWVDKDDDLGRAWVKYGSSDAAEECFSKMNGRWFAGRKIKADVWKRSAWQDIVPQGSNGE
eukprot:TRINITY_DN10293_c0_g1_i1.p1 TRINITY_DN10293_c0_g1~~TRINITY_DN10293_c0_g1_i1.p1  ORF type:complete len:376 (+),score=91.69 TRINITY_DN10293_c0_g1_i1:91-1218(+)